MKLLFVILDGAGDAPSALETARTPHLDEIAQRSKGGMLFPIKGVAPESDQAMMALLGYSPYTYYTGRGPLEAYDAGVRFGEGDIVFRGNFSVIKNGIITEPSVEITEDVNAKLCALLNEKLDMTGVKFQTTKGYRFALVLSRRGLSSAVQNTHPGYAVIKNRVSTALEERTGAAPRICEPLDGSLEAKKTADLVNEITARVSTILQDNPTANYILLRGAGDSLPELPPAQGKWCMLADSHADATIGKLAGMHVHKKPESNAELAKKVVSLYLYDSVCVQIKSPDKYSHRKDFQGKVKALEEIDRDFFSVVKNIPGITIAITADHATSSALGAHTKDSVPICITSKKPDGTRRLSETACRKGSLGELDGSAMMETINKIENE
ncbi:MAG: hypothetical protein HY364_04965 [Candidatus Aenigmarchaeota archaeon]|nr:hypothetical protein [Candidatus Aenigmarchaeota archaeon]